MMEKLKPCPFCGGTGKIKAAKKDYIGFTIWCECKKAVQKQMDIVQTLKLKILQLKTLILAKTKL